MKYKFNELAIDGHIDFDYNEKKDYYRISQAVYRARNKDANLHIGLKVIGKTIRVTRYKDLK